MTGFDKIVSRGFKFSDFNNEYAAILDFKIDRLCLCSSKIFIRCVYMNKYSERFLWGYNISRSTIATSYIHNYKNPDGFIMPVIVIPMWMVKHMEENTLKSENGPGRLEYTLLKSQGLGYCKEEYNEEYTEEDEPF